MTQRKRRARAGESDECTDDENEEASEREESALAESKGLVTRYSYLDIAAGSGNIGDNALFGTFAEGLPIPIFANNGATGTWKKLFSSGSQWRKN